MGEGTSFIRLQSEDQDGDTSLSYHFFIVGAASDISFNVFWLNVEYLRSKLGNDALHDIGNAQFCGSCLAMITLFAYSLYQPGRQVAAVSRQCTVMLLLMAYMLCLNCAMLLCVAMAWPLDLTWLRVAIVLNGVSTGASQGLGGRLTGYMTKVASSEARPSLATVASKHMYGVGFGISLPTAVQLLLMPFDMPASLLAAMSFTLGAVIMVLGIIALKRIKGISAFSRFEQIMSTRSQAFQEHYGRWLVGRLRHVGLQSLGLLTNYATGIYLALMAVVVPPQGSIPLPGQLPTFLICIANICDFVGRALMTRCLDVYSSTMQRPLYICVVVLVLFVRVGLAGFVLAYCLLSDHPSWMAESNVFIACLYAIGAIAGGGVTIALTQHAQTVCKGNSGVTLKEESTIECPLAAQIMFLACILGSLVGTFMPPP